MVCGRKVARSQDMGPGAGGRGLGPGGRGARVGINKELHAFCLFLLKVELDRDSFPVVILAGELLGVVAAVGGPGDAYCCGVLLQTRGHPGLVLLPPQYWLHGHGQY